MIMARLFNMEIYERAYYKGPKFKRSASMIKDTSGPVLYHITQNFTFCSDGFEGNKIVFFI